MIIENLFPTAIGFFKHDDRLSTVEESFLLSQEQRSNDGNTSSVDKYILNHDKVKDLKKL